MKTTVALPYASLLRQRIWMVELLSGADGDLVFLPRRDNVPDNVYFLVAKIRGTAAGNLLSN